MRSTFRVRYGDGEVVDAPGIPAPVPGLAIIQVTCQCHDALHAITHTRSGTGLMFAHSVEEFGQVVWAALAKVDWQRSAADLIQDRLVTEAVATAMVACPGSFLSETAQIVDDLPSDGSSLVEVNGTFREPERD